MKKINYQNNRKQHGAVLVMALLMLFVLTLIGVSSINTTTLEEKMSGNSRNRSLAFQATESAVRDAENYIESTISNPTAQFTGSNGLYALGAGPSSTDAVTNSWWSAGSNSKKTYTSTLQDVSNLPQYTIEYIGEMKVDTPTAGALNGGESPGGQGIISAFRITARGTGLTKKSVVVIQSNYAKRI